MHDRWLGWKGIDEVSHIWFVQDALLGGLHTWAMVSHGNDVLAGLCDQQAHIGHARRIGRARVPIVKEGIDCP